MACRAVEIWTFTSLIGAYLDLALASLLLIGATIAFVTSKLLSLFGLSLPCSCDGHFGHPACTQTSLLLDFPASRVSSVHRSLMSRFPYDSLLSSGASPSRRCRYGVRLPTEEGDTTSSLEKFSSASAERDSVGIWNSDEEGGAGSAEVAATGEEKDSWSDVRGVSGHCEGEGSDVMSLEKELEDERGSLAALYLELEKERNAAATAADEAMSMILRLQKEKAEIEMEARQYQRMIEEKSAYDEEEMEILKEIIVRREREKHVLEKEIEMYKQTLDSGENFGQDFDSEQNFFKEKKGTLNDSSDSPMMLLRQIYKSIVKKEVSYGFGRESLSTVNLSGACSYQGNSVENFVDMGKHVELFNNGDECEQEFHEKNMLSMQIKPSSSSILNFRLTDDLNNLNEACKSEYNKDIEDLTVRDDRDGGIPIETMVPDDDLCRIEINTPDQRCRESSRPEAGSSIHNVHIINDGQYFQVEENSKENVIPLEEESSCANFNEMESNIQRSYSECTNRAGWMCSLSGTASFLDLRRSSLPSVKSERYKLGTEVEQLRKRLEIIRQGRENLNLQIDHKEKESFQLQLLDEIACQLKQIKKVSEPTKSFRRASLPPLSPKDS